MQVILLQDVPNVGKKFEEAEVANGYGTNYLIPNGLAQVANDDTRARYKKQQEAAEAARHEAREKLAQAVEKIGGSSVTINVQNAGDQGQLFAGIYPKDIAAAINEEFDVEITGTDVDRDQPISKVGEEEIEVTILDTTVTVTVNVEAANFNAEDPNAEDPKSSSDEDDRASESVVDSSEDDEIPSEEQGDDSGEEEPASA